MQRVWTTVAAIAIAGCGTTRSKPARSDTVAVADPDSDPDPDPDPDSDRDPDSDPDPDRNPDSDSDPDPVPDREHVPDPGPAYQPVSPLTLPGFDTQPIAGRVILSSAAPLYPTADAARAGGGASGSRTDLASARVVRDLGDVLELELVADRNDCVDDHDLSYTLRVFAPRAALVARVTRPLTTVHGDGTGFHLRVGAPVRPYDDGAIRADDWLATRARATAPIGAVGYGVTPPAKPSALPASGGEPAICRDPEAERRAEERRAAERARAEAEAEERRAKCEEEVAAEQARAAARAKKKKKKRKDDDSVDMLAALSVPPDPAFASTLCALQGESSGFDFSDGMMAEQPPRCRLSDQGGEPPLTIAGAPSIDPADLTWRRIGEDVEMKDGVYLVTLAEPCTEVRAIAVADNFRTGPGGGAGGIGGGFGTVTYFAPKRGAKVTWPDGSPAGSYLGPPAGSYRGGRYYTEAQLRRDGDRACVKVPPLAAELCHRAKDLVETTRSPW